MFTSLLASFILAQNLNNQPVIHPQKGNIKHVKMLKGSVSAIDMLPDEIYGKWSVKSVLLNSDDSGEFKNTTSDIWVFRRMGDDITLTNPVTQAMASIDIDEVINNKARFSRTTINAEEKEKETVIIEIDGDEFFGVDTFVIEKYKDGKLISQNIVKYKLRGSKISGQESIFRH